MITDRTAVYRLYDADGSLLYVGTSNQPEARWKQHAPEKPWWPQVARKDIEWYPDRPKALTAEALAIITESPRYNVVAPARDPETFHATTIRLPEELYQRLRKAAFDQSANMNDLVCQGVELRLAELETDRRLRLLQHIRREGGAENDR